MLIIVDYRISRKAKDRLSFYGDLLELYTEGITYPAISGHPDIFICQGPDQVITASNLPPHYLGILKKLDLHVISGEFPVGMDYPATARYNAVVTDKYLIHNFRHTDFSITRAFEGHIPVHVDQGYCRCNLLALKEDHFITSDGGIYKVLKRQGLDVLHVCPEGIKLTGFPNGFFGGCCGVWEDKAFINGSLAHFPEGDRVKRYLRGLDYEIIELCDGLLVDVGGIITLRVSGNEYPEGLRNRTP